ncbi:MAG: UDP-3-O-(3-hydroxymyristoyl)glucosamine N-acyltransferase [Acidobacteriaceae bacterium]|nr:UDP-3-O-(3-hydroxymyristoyl)glucosamine N-acyltransferase [Acidobacteriaceae bacterium]
MSALTVAQLAQHCGGTIEGDPLRVIKTANALESAGPDDLSFVDERKISDAVQRSQAGCLLVPLAFDLVGPWSIIKVPQPRVAFAKALRALYQKPEQRPAVHPTAIVAVSASVAPDCSIGAYCTVGEDTIIGAGSSIGPGCVIGDSVRIGSQTKLYANVTIYDQVEIGSRVIVHSGCVLGADGFGFTLNAGKYEKFPQVGTVVIEDDVELGANTCVDRAALGITRIGKGTKLDNLIHVAHNCELGCNVVVAAQTGFSGSVTVGDFAAIGGQAGIGEKAKIDANAIIGGKAGVLTSQRIRAGEPVWGIPARPLRQHLKGLANVAKLSELRLELRELRRKVAQLTKPKEEEKTRI